MTPDKAESSVRFSEKIADAFSDRLQVLDLSLAQAAYASVSPPTPFNLTADESKRIGAVIGCDYFVLLRSVVQRRSAFQKKDYFEAYAVIYVVSSKTGQLILWKLPTFESVNTDLSEKILDDAASAISTDLETAMREASRKELTAADPLAIEEVPDLNSPAAKNFRAPIPYRRVKPEYTEMAALYDVTATVEILVDTDAAGTIARTEIVRWAGFGLDDSVDKTVRAMNWRPAERNGKSLPMRFLLRYNFKKVDKN
ncbi:MAG: energy transducer TonB [Pyrinomonadaceae bacterium]